jgi:hypothetical protein
MKDYSYNYYCTSNWQDAETDNQLLSIYCWHNLFTSSILGVYFILNQSQDGAGLSNSQSPHCSTTHFGCEDTMKPDTRGAWASLPCPRTHPRLATKSTIHCLLVTLHNTGWMYHCQVCYGSCEAIPIFHSVNANEAYSDVALRYHSLWWHVQSHGWRYAIFS